MWRITTFYELRLIYNIFYYFTNPIFLNNFLVLFLKIIYKSQFELISSSRQKLTRRETGLISIIHELEAITRGYMALKGGAKATPSTLDGLAVSPKMYGFVQTELMGVDLATDK